MFTRAPGAWGLWLPLCLFLLALALANAQGVWGRVASSGTSGGCCMLVPEVLLAITLLGLMGLGVWPGGFGGGGVGPGSLWVGFATPQRPAQPCLAGPMSRPQRLAEGMPAATLPAPTAPASLLQRMMGEGSQSSAGRTGNSASTNSEPVTQEAEAGSQDAFSGSASANPQPPTEDPDFTAPRSCLKGSRAKQARAKLSFAFGQDLQGGTGGNAPTSDGG